MYFGKDLQVKPAAAPEGSFVKQPLAESWEDSSCHHTTNDTVDRNLFNDMFEAFGALGSNGKKMTSEHFYRAKTIFEKFGKDARTFVGAFELVVDKKFGMGGPPEEVFVKLGLEVERVAFN